MNVLSFSSFCVGWLRLRRHWSWKAVLRFQVIELELRDLSGTVFRPVTGFSVAEPGAVRLPCETQLDVAVAPRELGPDVHELVDVICTACSRPAWYGWRAELQTRIGRLAQIAGPEPIAGTLRVANSFHQPVLRP
jgi:hypothetical protein